jgi:hypothetical protein
MKIVKGLPPNYKYLKQHFPYIVGRPIAITYGDTMYATNDAPITEHLIAHEEVHSKDQLAYKEGVDAYVNRFIADSQFRLEAELKAFIVQLRFIKKKHGDHSALLMLPTFISQLSGPLYHNLLSPLEARKKLMAYTKKE